MAVAENQSLEDYCQTVAQSAREASVELGRVSGQQKNDWLNESAKALRDATDDILVANQRDIEAAPGYGLTDAQTDRLRLDVDRVDKIARGLEEVAMLADPVGETIESSVRPSGLQVSKVRVPLGVVFFIYESRPNVTADAAAICVKSGNAVILRGGKEAAHSSRAIIDVMYRVGEAIGIPAAAVQLVRTTDRAAVGHFLKMPESIDVAIPRGGEGLIRRVAAEAEMPVIKHFTGNCHVYIDSEMNEELAVALTVNSKCQRMGVCNAAESLLVHDRVAESILPKIASALQGQGVEIRGDARTCELVPGAVEAGDEDYKQEYLGPIISAKVVASLDDAVRHINANGSHHTDAIVTTNLDSARQFTRDVDSSAVMVNASTRFNDGDEFGLGAEIGISTDKFHARGPCGLRELTSYKYVVFGDGQTM